MRETILRVTPLKVATAILFAVALVGCNGSIPNNVATACANVSALKSVVVAAQVLGSAVPGLDAALAVAQPLVDSACANQPQVDAALATLQALVVKTAN